MKEQFKELEEGLNKLINVRKCIRDVHRDDMIQIADKLDGNKKNAHIAKAIGLFVSIGGTYMKHHIYHIKGINKGIFRKISSKAFKSHY